MYLAGKPPPSTIRIGKCGINETLHDGRTVANVCYTPCSEVVPADTTIAVAEALSIGREAACLDVNGGVQAIA